MKHFYIAKCLVLLMMVGLGFCVAGCRRDSVNYDPDFPLSDYVEAVVQYVGEQEDPAANAYTELKFSACLVNKTADEIQVFFFSKQCLSNGGFRVRFGSEPRLYVPKVSLKNTNSSKADYVLPSYGRREFDLLLDLPKTQARQLMAKGNMQIILILNGIRHNGTYTDIGEPNNKVIARWKK